MEQFHWDPNTYLELMRQEVPDYEALQDALVLASRDAEVETILELGIGSGQTARRLLDAHPRARVVGLDASADMLEAARMALPSGRVRLHQRRLEDPLPEGPYDLVASALAIHHLEGPAKAELFQRVASVLRPGGRFVLADVVVPADPADAITPIDGAYDKPSAVEDQLRWLAAAGLTAHVAWSRRDLAVVVADRSSGLVAHGHPPAWALDRPDGDGGQPPGCAARSPTQEPSANFASSDILSGVRRGGLYRPVQERGRFAGVSR